MSERQTRVLPKMVFRLSNALLQNRAKHKNSRKVYAPNADDNTGKVILLVAGETTTEMYESDGVLYITKGEKPFTFTC